MSYKVSFMDNQICGVDDFNSILGDIAQEGIITNDFDKTSAYQMSKMNIATKNLISQGVAENETSLACSVGMKGSENGVYIAPGLGIFGSGARIKVTESEFVSFEEKTNCYIYAYHDMKNNLAGFKAATEGFPAEMENELYVLELCQFVNGVFTDKRKYAKAKMRVCDTINAVKEMVLNIPNADYDGQEIVILNATPKTSLNFFAFATIEEIVIVKESSYGVFSVFNSTRDSNATLDTVSQIRLWNGTGTNYTYLRNFKRDANGNICAKVSSGLLESSFKYILYASVYEEVSE